MEKKNEQRIWNKSELEQMDEWRVRNCGTWINDECNHCINSSMLGKTVQWCKAQGYTVTDEMIAKERLDKGEIDIGEYWTKTMDLRFRIATFGNNVLQQKHISNLGNENWIDIETFLL